MTVTEPEQRYPLVESFAGSADSGLDAIQESERLRLEQALQQAWTVARESWPGLEVSAPAFAARLGRASGDAANPLTAIEELVTSDLYLACAAMGGDGRALTQFEAHTFGEIQSAAAALRASDTDAEEVKQIVRTILFVSDGDRAASIGEYAGRGSLRGWVRVIATREFLRLRRKARKEIPLEEHILNDLESHGDAEIEQVKHMYRAQVANALREAIGTLDVRDRLLLRYHICDRLSIDEIGGIYRVHRATAARWLSKARTSLLELTKEHLAVLLSVDPDETDNILRLVQSQLDVSLERRLREDA